MPRRRSAETVDIELDAAGHHSVASRLARVAAPHHAATMLGIGRILAGATFLAFPTRAIRAYGLDTATAERTSWLARMFGVRDAVLGTGTLATAGIRRGGSAWLLAGAVSDGVDALVTLDSLRTGRVDRLRGRALVVVGASASALGLLSAARLLVPFRRLPFRRLPFRRRG